MTPTPRVFASASGEYALKVIPQQRAPYAAKATLYTLDRSGNQLVLWSVNLVNMPVEVHVSNGGRVLTLNTWHTAGYEHSVVVYGDDGAPVADHKLESLLTKEQILKVPTSVSSRWWSGEVPTLSRVPAGTDFGAKVIGKHRAWRALKEEAVITTHAGDRIVVDLVSGAVRSG